MAMLDAVTLRPERAGDEAFLFALFRGHVFAALPEALIRMQFASQTATYRALFPDARFDIVERDGIPIGRLIVDDGADVGCIVDFALLAECRGGGLGTAILARTMERFDAMRCKVMMHNAASLRMCRKLGFLPIGGDPPFLQLEWRREPPLPPGQERVK